MGSARVSGRMIYFFGALGGVLFGYDTGVISGALLFIPNDFKLTPFLQGAIVAGLLLGAMIGAAFAGRLSDRLGRRRLIIIAAVVFTGGALLAAAAPTVWVLIAARVIIGLAVGSAALVVPLYLSEIAPTEVRGAITSLNQLMVVCGILAAFIVNAILASSGDWRLMLGLAAVPSMVLLVGMLFMPETPRYLVHAGEEKEAHEVLEELPGDERPEERIEEIREVDSEDEGGDRARRAVACQVGAPGASGRDRARCVPAAGRDQHDHLLRTDDTDQCRLRQDERDLRQPDHRRDQRRVNGGRGQAHRPGRPKADAVRGCSRHGGEPAGARSLAVGLPTPHHPGDPAAIITLVCLATFIAAFAATWGPVVWVMIPEVLPLSVRGTAMGVAVFGNWAANFAVSQTFPPLLKALGPGTVFLGYAALGCSPACS